MRCILTCSVVLLFLVGRVFAEDAKKPEHVVLNSSEIKWSDAPPVLEKGASLVVISGDPSKSGMFVIRLKMPAGYKIAPQWHPTDEHITVISGTVAFGMGEKFDELDMTEVSPGGYALMPAEMRHFAMAHTEAIVQVQGMGPFALTYVNPADDPSQRDEPK